MPRAETTNRLKGDADDDRFQQALVGRGGPNGDQLYDPFGLRPRNSEELVRWLAPVVEDTTTNEQPTFDLIARRPLPWLGGGLALGGHYRSERQEDDLDRRTLANAPAGLELDEERDIWAVFAELQLFPLETLELQLALRYEDYEDFGDTLDPKLGFRWQILPELAVRGTYSTSFSAPAFG